MYCGEDHSARCVWRPGPLPDSRFRPDQRLLEEGKVQEAEDSKKQLEETEEKRIKTNQQLGKCHEPKWFRRTAVASDDEDGEKWEFANTFWDARADSKFGDMDLVRLW